MLACAGAGNGGDGATWPTRTEQQHGKCTGIGCGMMLLITEQDGPVPVEVQLRAQGERVAGSFLSGTHLTLNKILTLLSC